MARCGPAPADQPREAADAARECRACRLWERGTQTVFGTGAKHARLMLIGEQPGDREDKIGKPFVGPAGQLLDEALKMAGIDRRTTYLTNVVKHFSWEERGKRRIHQKTESRRDSRVPSVAGSRTGGGRAGTRRLPRGHRGAGLLGPSFRVTQERGRVLRSPLAPRVLATVHPSSILRAEDEETREQELQRFIADLTFASKVMRDGLRDTGLGFDGGATVERHD
jgi:DNA polymerase